MSRRDPLTAGGRLVLDEVLLVARLKLPHVGRHQAGEVGPGVLGQFVPEASFDAEEVIIGSG